MATRRKWRPPLAEIQHPADAALEIAIRQAQRAGERFCIGCGEQKPLEEFAVRGRGRSLTCAHCRRGDALDALRADATKEAAAITDEPAAITAMMTAVEQTVTYTAGVAKRVSRLSAASGISDDGVGEGDADIEHTALFSPEVRASVVKFVRGTVKGTAALMVRDMVRSAVREAAAEIVPAMVERMVEEAVARALSERRDAAASNGHTIESCGDCGRAVAYVRG